ncbi:hypothetical protein EB796_017213 [Bugula neritina]|uniref:Uncharacterized protein n=1 Tax=Bugula neritina TaxID=10212 RepID=A0A7J7JEE1_BUGNE|nr:hypothetical protein EB796_017213 [Bugula neritina]
MSKLEITEFATCELVLTGDVEDTKSPYVGHFAMAPAHLVLEERQCVELLKADAPSDALEHMRDVVAGINRKMRYAVETKQTSKSIDLLMDSSLLIYRHYKNERASENDCKNFLNDIVLFQIKYRHLVDPENRRLMAQINTACGESTKPGLKASMIFPCSAEDLKQMSRRRVCVKVKGADGHVVQGDLRREDTTVDQGKRMVLHHIQFVLEHGA